MTENDTSQTYKTYTHSYTAYSKNQIQGITLIDNLNSEPESVQ